MSINFVYAVAAAVVVGILLLVKLSFTKRWPKVILAGLVLVGIAVASGYFWYMRPIEFPRNYERKSRSLEAAQVTIAETATEKAFFVGAAVYRASDIDNQWFGQSFNSVTPANALKLGAVNTNLDRLEYDFSEGYEFVHRARSKGLRVRGHTLVFGKLSDVYRSPDLEAWLTQFDGADEKKERLLHLLEHHIKTVVQHYQNDIYEWDVVNEPLAMFGDGKIEENVFYRHLGEDYTSLAFDYARKYAPNAKLFVNEQFNNYTGKKANNFRKWLKSQLEAGVPIDGVGLQGHRLFYLETPENTRSFIQSIVDLGVDVEITELDARLRLFKDAPNPYEAQGEYYRSIVKTCYEIHRCRGVSFWGFTDRDSWHDELPYMFSKPNEPYLFDNQGLAKPGLWLIDQYLSEAESRGFRGVEM